MTKHGFSPRRACRLIEVAPKTVRRQATADAPEVRQRLRELAGERRRFGYRRLGILLAREGMGLNHKKLLRLYREEGLAVPPGARHQAVPDRPRQLRSAAQGALDRLDPHRRISLRGHQPKKPVAERAAPVAERVAGGSISPTQKVLGTLYGISTPGPTKWCRHMPNVAEPFPFRAPAQRGRNGEK